MLMLRVETDNAAFADGNQESELARILRDIADEIGRGVAGGPFKIRDANGNTVGTWKLTR